MKIAVAIFFVFFLPFELLAQKKIILLKPNEKLSIENYQIQQVIDDRADKDNIGSIRIPISGKTARLDLQNGASAAVKDFIKNNILQNKNGENISLHIVALNVHDEKNGVQKKTTLDAKFAFYSNNEKLVDYSGSSVVQGAGDATPYIGKLVSQSIEGVLKEFDGWFLQNKQRLQDSKTFLVKVVLPQQSDDNDKIIFSKNNLLQISDFIGKPDALSEGVGATFSGFSVSYEISNKTGPFVATIEVMPFMQRSHSWMKKEGKNAIVLRHEQMHFNITGYITCEFIKAVEAFNFSKENFKPEINALQKKYVDMITQTQEQYDDETNHGQNVAKQKEWEDKIMSEVNKADCYR